MRTTPFESLGHLKSPCLTIYAGTAVRRARAHVVVVAGPHDPDVHRGVADPGRVDPDRHDRAWIEIGIERERVVVAVGAHVARVLHAPSDVEERLGGVRVLLAPRRDDAAVQPLHSDVGIAHDHPGYFTTLDVLESLFTSTENGGRTVTASVDSALKINTVPTDPDNPETGLSVQVGKLSCQSVDNR